METVTLRLNPKNHGAFYLEQDGETIGEMMIAVDGEKVTAFHTEIIPQAEGKGLARHLLNALVNYAREHHLKVLPLCAYVRSQFLKHPELYSDLWTPATNTTGDTDTRDPA